MIAPPFPASTICSPNTWQARKTLRRLMSSNFCHSASVISKKWVPELTPAAFMSISTPPNSSTARRRASNSADFRVASQATAMAWPPAARIASARASACAKFRSATTTRAPAPANPIAISPASTPPPPTTTAVLPDKENRF